jgi:hypothetical protein
MRKTKILLLSICLLLVGAYTVNASPVDSGNDEKQILREKVALTYSAQIGVRETLGSNDSPEIRQYLKSTNLSAPAPYCAAMVSYCFTVNGIKNPKSAWSPNWFPKANLVNCKSSPPLQADVFGVWYNNLNRIAHVGFIDQWPREGDHFISVEGNTNDNGSREGNGVYKKRRLKRTAHKISRWI